MSTVTLTEMQTAVLLAFPGGAAAEGDNGASWTEVADLATATGLSKKQVQGVLSGLSARGFIYADEEKANGAKGTLQCLTDEGARLVGRISDTPEDAALVMAEVAAEVAGFDQAAAEPVAAEGVVADTLAFIAAQVEEPEAGEPEAEEPEADLDQEAAEVLLDAEPVAEAETREEEEEVEAEGEAPTKLVVMLDGKAVESRRVPSPTNRKLVTDLVVAFGGKTFTAKEAEGAGFDADALRLAMKRCRSWWGAKSVTAVRGKEPGWSLAVTMPVA